MTKYLELVPKYNAQNKAKNGFRNLVLWFVFASLLMACASTPPSKTLPQSKVAVTSVDHANFRKYVSDDIDSVKNKLIKAQAHATEKQHAEAEHLSQQILVDVELIQIKTQRLIVEQEVKQIESSVSNLNEELKWREPVQVTPIN